MSMPREESTQSATQINLQRRKLTFLEYLEAEVDIVGHGGLGQFIQGKLNSLELVIMLC